MSIKEAQQDIKENKDSEFSNSSDSNNINRKVVKSFRVLLLIGFIINFLTFITIAIISVLSCQSSNFALAKTLYEYGNAFLSYEEMFFSEYLIVASKNEKYIQQYYNARAQLNSSLSYAFNVISNENSSMGFSLNWISVENQVIHQAESGNFSQALNILKSPESREAAANFGDFFGSILDTLFSISERKEMDYLNYTTIGLTVVCVCLAIALPIVLMIFIGAIKMDRDSRRNLEKVRAVSVIHSMSDTFVRDLFKKYVEKDRMIYFEFLEHVQLFKERKRSISSTIQSILDEMKRETVNETSSLDDESSVLSFTSDLFLQIKSETDDIQAIDIYNRFLNPETKNFIKYSNHKKILMEINNQKDPEILSTVFDGLQIEFAKKLLKSHELFTQSQSISNHDIEDQLLFYRANYLSVFKPQKRNSLFQ